MADIELNWVSEKFGADFSFNGGDLSQNNELRSAVVLSLFSWRRANADDRLPDDTGELNGWWGDRFGEFTDSKLGSRLWLLRREKLTQQTIARAKEYCEEALQWLIEDKVAKSVLVVTERNLIDRLDISITITRADGAEIDLKFSNVWELIKAGA